MCNIDVRQIITSGVGVIMQSSNRRIFLAGDSTVQTYHNSEDNQGGWGEFLSNHFSEEVHVMNHSIGGRSSKTFVEEGRLQKILEEITEGDFLFIQMGHNDSTKAKLERYTEPFTTYKDYLKMYIEGARKYYAIPILITPVARLHVVNGHFINDFQDYCTAMKDLAEEEDVILIDLMKNSLDFYENLGYEQSLGLFMASINQKDYTHFTKKGAKEIARLIVQTITEKDLLPKEVMIDLKRKMIKKS